MSDLEQSLASHPDAAAAGAVATSLYANGLVGSALAVFEQSRHLDKPWFGANQAMDGRPGLYNPDTRYASALLSGDGHYRITGRRGSHALFTLQVIDDYPIVGLGRNLDALDLDAQGIGPGEDFEIQLGGARRLGDLWFPLAGNARALLSRQTFADWTTESPSRLTIERMDQAPATWDSSIEMQTAADFVRAADRTWNSGHLPWLRTLPLNQIGVPRPSDSGAGGLGGQFSAAGRYRIGPRQALIVAVRHSDARYQGIQLGNPWYVTPHYADHQVSLTSRQAVIDPDGVLRFVISLDDPGVVNWLDPAGFAEGYCWLRWQGLDRALGESDAPRVELVDLVDVASALPEGTTRVTPPERAAQLALRARPPLRQ